MALTAALHTEPYEMFLELRADGEDGIERCHRRLRDEGDGVAQQVAPARRSHSDQIFALEQERTAGNGKAERQQLRDRAPDHGFAGTGFADQAKDFPRREIKRQRADCRNAFAAKAGADGQIVCLQRQHGSSVPLPQAAHRACGAVRRRAD